MRPWSLVIALTLLLGSLWLFLGGLGPVMRRELIFEQTALPLSGQWAVLLVFLGVWWGGLVCCVVRARALFRAIGTCRSRRWRVGEGLVLMGHAALLAVLVGLTLGVFSLQHGLGLYGLLMAAAGCYAAGLGALALAGTDARPPLP